MLSEDQIKECVEISINLATKNTCRFSLYFPTKDTCREEEPGHQKENCAPAVESLDDSLSLYL